MLFVCLILYTLLLHKNYLFFQFVIFIHCTFLVKSSLCVFALHILHMEIVVFFRVLQYIHVMWCVILVRSLISCWCWLFQDITFLMILEISWCWWCHEIMVFGDIDMLRSCDLMISRCPDIVILMIFGVLWVTTLSTYLCTY